ncbi:glycoside hydrolase family 3 C-terminal domain-containing protein [Streptomyces sp. F63]|nr:glycoside hydrolase family 3 N-terminal domain-containing protein [Streptomyces sp. F63]MBQ0987742.1 glycoside hydrolase family 3 C-terminal domain-containing protein [Streptomyces sp. F63]
MHPETKGPWQDTSLSTGARVSDLLTRMTLEEKLAQLFSIWPGSDNEGEDVAPLQHEMTASGEPADLDALIRHGLGQLTRAFGTAPVEPAAGAAALARTQARIAAANRFGIPAIAHEECLTGFTTWGATVFPTPLAWGATFNPALVGRAAELIGSTMRSAGIHQGLSPVLDVVRDPRWGRTEESISEDPYLVATIGTAYVRGLESSGVIATLKHFAGYSASRAGRNHAPVSAGRRELADVLLPPFELAVRDGGARSVMQAYNEIDGVPAAADPWLLTELLRDAWGFTGTVVADYFGISFLESAHHVAGSPREAAGMALAAGVDVELPAVRCYGTPLLDAVRAGDVPESLVDRAVSRVLRQKCELGLLDPDWDPAPPVLAGPPAAVTGPAGAPADGTAAQDTAGDGGAVAPLTAAREAALRPGTVPGAAGADFDPAEMRAVARQLAEESVVLLANDAGLLPLTAGPGTRIAVVGPLADDPAAMLGCYTFPRHVGVEHPELPLGVEVPTLLKAVREALPEAEISHVPGCAPPEPEKSGAVAAGVTGAGSAPLGGVLTKAETAAGGAGLPTAAELLDAEAGLLTEAVALAAGADVCVAVLGDRSGLFGRGTSGEGCDAADLELPGAQGALLDALLATGTPVVLVLLTGRPYALGRYAGPGRSGGTPPAAAVVQAFFPGEEGGPAVAGVLSGQVNPSGRLPVSVPYGPGGQPWTYLAPQLGLHNEASSLDPTPLYPFGHGLSYTAFAWTGGGVEPADGSPAGADGDGTVLLDTDDEATVRLTVRNTGDRPGTETVQLYLHDPVARTTRPVNRLIGYARVPLGPGEAAEVRFGFHTDLAAYTTRDGRRIVDSGDLELRLGASSADIRHTSRVRLSGAERTVGHCRRMVCAAMVHRLGVPGQGAAPAAPEAAREESGTVAVAPSGRSL